MNISHTKPMDTFPHTLICMVQTETPSQTSQPNFEPAN